MANIQKLLENKKHIKISAVIFALMLVLFFNPVSESINYTLQGFFQKLAGESTPDSNLVIIKIDAQDIEKLGSWPLKRSYYALLLSYLNQYDVKGIGIEIFLSDNLSFQAVYTETLNLNRSGCNMHSVHFLSKVNICGKLFQNPLNVSKLLN